jgi:hydrogenase nickel incorporation protein HypA/HybF
MDMQVCYDFHVHSPIGNVLAEGFKPLLIQRPRCQIHRNQSKITCDDFDAIFFYCCRKPNLVMHEWALAEAVLASARQIAEQNHLKIVTEVTIRVGALQQVEPPILRFALSQIKDGILKNAKFRILRAKSTLKCRVCGNTWEFNRKKLDKATSEAIHFIPEAAHSYVKCPECGSPDFEIASGRGVWLEDIKGAQ